MSNQMPREVIVSALKEARRAEAYILERAEAAGTIEETLYIMEQLGDVREAISNLKEVLDISS